jgi:hypothetical protein
MYFYKFELVRDRIKVLLGLLNTVFTVFMIQLSDILNYGTNLH